MDYDLWMVIGLLLMVMAFGLIFIAYAMDKQSKKRQQHLKVKQNQEQVNGYYLSLYKFFSGFSPTKHKIANIRLRIEMIGHTGPHGFFDGRHDYDYKTAYTASAILVGYMAFIGDCD
ncbi:MAG: hypothetical protein CVU95_01090 [Firmicutes bacterium HGW-Firmicutes-2]|nr:MAG: hypothetical protein CVU95_01090 [Firmicutes bacterium HGW-Firmicutes-2]